MEEALKNTFLKWLGEDIPFWDETAEALIPEGVRVRAYIYAKSRGVAACLGEVSKILESLGLSARPLVPEGSRVEGGERIMELVGEARKILAVERTVLNLLSHCFGVAWATARLVEEAKRANPGVRVAATRKTLPGLRYFEKRAVMAAGGDTHRLSLSDTILIKDNHLKIVGSVGEAVRLARERASFTRRIEVEASTVEEAVEAAEAGADIVMLDNFSPEDVGRAVRALEERGLRGRVIVEASGGINPDNVAEYAGQGVDVVSSGWITHSAKAVDLSLEVEEVLEE